MNNPQDTFKFKRSVYYTLSFIAVIWLVKILETVLEADFGMFGILPRTLQGSLGIFVAPLIHGDFFHLLSNTFPLLFLGIGLFYFYDKVAIQVVVLIYLMTGFWVWMTAREAYHIGASGVVYGLLTFILFSGFLQKDVKALAVSFVIFVLYGGTFITGIFPSKPEISWESHFMGGVAGIFCAVYFRNSLKVAVTKVKENIPTNLIYYYKEKDELNQKPEIYTYLLDKNETNDLENNTYE